MSLELGVTIQNAQTLLQSGIPKLADGTLTQLAHAHGLGALYRSRGVSQLLLRGAAEPLLLAQMQSSSLYAYALGRAREDDKATSLGGCLWDAIAAGYRDAAQQIAVASRMTHNPDREHEDDFLYVAYLLQRYFLAPAQDATEEDNVAHAAAQAERLRRWEEVVADGLDSRLVLCHALQDRDVDTFGEAIVAMADERDADLVRRQAKGALTKEDLAWLRPVWPQGLALLRLAEHDGLSTEGLQVPRVPPVLQTDNRYQYDPGSWQHVDYQPILRPA